MVETIEIKPTPSEQSASATSDVTRHVTKPANRESTAIAPYLFDDDIGMPHTQEADFFGTIGTLYSAILDHVQVPHQSFAQHLQLLLHLVRGHQVLRVREPEVTGGGGGGDRKGTSNVAWHPDMLTCDSELCKHGFRSVVLSRC